MSSIAGDDGENCSRKRTMEVSNSSSSSSSQRQQQHSTPMPSAINTAPQPLKPKWSGDRSNKQKKGGSVTNDQSKTKSNTVAKPFLAPDGIEYPSKNAYKKKEKKILFDKKHKIRKDNVKEVKRLKREEKGQLAVLNQPLDEESIKRREAASERLKNMRLKQADKSFKVLVDCSFTSQLTEKECGSLGLQLMYSYAFNKRNRSNPVHLQVSELNGGVASYLENLSGYPDKWEALWKADTLPLEQMHNVEDLVYLTADSDNVVEVLENDKVYVIGGIVDRNRLKNATLNAANGKRIKTARLPIDKYMNFGTATKVLTVNHVFEIVCRWAEGRDWKKAMVETLPARKEVKIVGDEKASVIGKDAEKGTGEDKNGGDEEGEGEEEE